MEQARHYYGAPKQQREPAKHVTALYSLETEISVESLPRADPADHTMVYALPGYITKKVPLAHMNEHLQQNLRSDRNAQPPLPFLVLGVYDGHFEDYCLARRWHACEMLRDFSKKDRTWGARKSHKEDQQRKHFYTQRPKLFSVLDLETNQKFFALVVFPGKDYVEHYASMVRSGFEMLKPNCTDEQGLLRVFWYPKAFEEMPNWCGLSDFEFRPGDVVLMGYVGFYRYSLKSGSSYWYVQQSPQGDSNLWEEHGVCGFSVGLQNTKIPHHSLRLSLLLLGRYRQEAGSALL